MNNNFSKRLEMQIPQENTYTSLDNIENFNTEFNNLTKNYKYMIHIQ